MKPLTRVAVVLCSLVTTATTVAAPASAGSSNAGVYAVASRSDGWCPGPLNKVTWVQWANHTTGGTAGDGGDDIVWMPVRTGVKNSVTISVKCKYSTPIGMNFTITPARNKQTFWFTPGGNYRKN